MEASSAESQQVDDLVSRGELARATALLLKRSRYRQNLATSANLYKQETVKDWAIDSELVHLFVQQSRYAEAYQHARKIEAGLGLAPISFRLALVLSHVVSLLFSIRKGFLGRQIFKALRSLSQEGPNNDRFGAIDAVLWGTYWQDMRRALILNCLTFFSAVTEEQELKAFAFLNYTLAYMGFKTGLRGLAHAIQIADRGSGREAQHLNSKDLLVWYGVALQMNAKSKDCLAVHRKLRDLFRDSEPFHLIISFASQLNMSISELGPVQSAKVAEECFSASFALKESRNHIQIYGGKAALLALEGRMREALEFLEKSRLAAVRNANTLDEIIFHRLAAITHLNLGVPDKAREHIRIGREAVRRYAPVLSYLHEFARLEVIARYQERPNQTTKLISTLQFMILGMTFPHAQFRRKTLKIAWRYLLESEPSYWSESESVEFLKGQLRKLSDTGRSTALERITIGLSKAMLSQDALSEDHDPNESDLRQLIEKCLPGDQVVYAKDLHECLDLVRARFGIANSFILNDESDCLRAPCENGTYLVAVQTQFSESAEARFAVGIVTSNIDLTSHEAIELALRVLSSLFCAQQLRWSAREERVKSANRIAMANLASQVSHDIRSPLSALNMMVGLISNLPEESRLIIRHATQRINDIANDLLNKSQALQAEPSPLEALQRSVMAVTLIERIVSEKRIQFRERHDIEIQVDLQQAYGLFVSFPSAELSRIISNLINNSVEAMPNGGHVQVYLRNQGKDVEISVRDNGAGIPQDVLGLIGLRGFSHGKNRKTNSGSGLGVWHARETLESAGGKLLIHSKENVGTMVTMRIPKASPPKWFLEGFAVERETVFVSVDDDQTIHQIWAGRIASLAATEGPNSKVGHRQFSSVSQLEVWLSSDIHARQTGPIWFLFDYDFIGHLENGLEAIERLRISDRSVLVTSRFDELKVLEKANRLGVSVVPKNQASTIPFKVCPVSRH